MSTCTSRGFLRARCIVCVTVLSPGAFPIASQLLGVAPSSAAAQAASVSCRSCCQAGRPGKAGAATGSRRHFAWKPQVT